MTIMGWEWWQAMAVTSMAVLVGSFSSWQLALRVRASLQPLVATHVEKGVSTVLFLQKFQSRFLDAFFGLSSVLVSKEFYTIFLPFLFWCGNRKLARQMTLLMAFSIYIGNCVKDTIAAPRPPCPPVRRFTATGSEKDFALEYGLPSSHTINTICLSGYVLLHLLRSMELPGIYATLLVFLFVIISIVTILGRLYLGMHTPIDIIAGMFLGTSLLAFWTCVEGPLDSFITGGTNVESFWASLTFLLLFAYPTPETPTPSFEFHTAFDGVALGVVCGVHRTYDLYHHEGATNLLVGGGLSNTSLVIFMILKRLIVGYPIILAAKLFSKELAKLLLPAICACLGIRNVKSSSYLVLPSVPAASPNQDKTSKDTAKKFEKEVVDPLANGPTATGSRRASSWLISPYFSNEVPFDIDTGIRFVQYAGLGWAVVELAPYFFQSINI